LKICFAALDYPDRDHGAGVGTYYKTVARQLSGLGHDVSVISLAKGRDTRTLHDGAVKVFYVTTSNLHWYISRVPLIRKIASAVRELEHSYALWKKVSDIHKEMSLDIVQSTETGSFFLALYQRRMSFRFVIRLHGEKYTVYKNCPEMKVNFDTWFCRLFQRFAIRRTNLLLSPSRSHAKSIRKELRKNKEILVIPNFLDYGYMDRIVGEKSLNDLGTARQVILYVGRLERGKGLWPLLEAAGCMNKKGGMEIWLAGNYHPTLKQTDLLECIRKNGLEDIVKILKHVPWEDLLRLYKRADVVVMPSYYETFGHTFIEAMFMSRPVIGFSGSSLEEIVENGRSGFIVERGDVVSLAGAMDKMLGDKELRESVGKEARKHAVERFAAPAIFPELLSFYEGLVRHADFLFLSPHFDDAVFSCGGIMSQYSKQGRNSLVITLFGGLPDSSGLSTFAREIHAKWRLADPVGMRMREDREALEVIGARQAFLEFLDCIYRKTEEGDPLYNDYEGIKGTLHPLDLKLCDEIDEKVGEILKGYDTGRTLIFVPLGVGNHVDHQIACEVGKRLMASGFRIFFYEEFPYCMWYPEEPRKSVQKHEGTLSPLVVSIDMKTKLKMIKHYRSQLSGIGGSYRKARRNFLKYALAVGNGTYAERVWTPGALTGTELTGEADSCGEMKCQTHSGNH